eukprot:gene5646-10876_t
MARLCTPGEIFMLVLMEFFRAHMSGKVVYKGLGWGQREGFQGTSGGLSSGELIGNVGTGSVAAGVGADLEWVFTEVGKVGADQVDIVVVGVVNIGCGRGLDSGRICGSFWNIQVKGLCQILIWCNPVGQVFWGEIVQGVRSMSIRAVSLVVADDTSDVTMVVKANAIVAMFGIPDL